MRPYQSLLLLVYPVLLSFGFASPCSAKSSVVVALPELVGRADVIVIGTVLKVGETSYHVKVTEKLVGTVEKEVTFPRWMDTRLLAGDTRFLFLVSTNTGLALVCQSAYRPLTQADEVRRLVDMRTSPAKYLADPGYAFTPDFLEILGFAFRGREKVGNLDRKTAADHPRPAVGSLDDPWQGTGLDRQAAVDHLRRALNLKNSQAVTRAVVALQRLGSKEAKAVIPLLKHPAEEVRRTAVHFLTWAPDPAAVGPLCEVLDAFRPNPESEGIGPRIEEGIGRALAEIGDPAAVPALERAVKRGVVGATSWALGWLGDKRSFETLLDAAEKWDSLEAQEGLRYLVLRSNKRIEVWMEEAKWSSETGLEHKQDWRKWWDANKADLKVVKTAKETFRGNSGER